MTGPFLVYDGDCPFCANYVAFLKLRENWPNLELVNAREFPEHSAVAKVRGCGLLIDEGMALVAGDRVIHGAEAIQSLASRSTGLNRALFASKGRSRAIYPLLRAGRNIVLRLLRRSKLGF